MTFEDLASRVTKYYGGLPGPDEWCFDCAAYLSVKLFPDVKTAGVIGVGLTEENYCCVAFSPDLQAEVKAQKLWQAVEGYVWSFQKGAPKSQKAKPFLCKVVDDAIATAAAYNKGCAEKKIITASNQYKDPLVAISVIEYPNGAGSDNLSAYVVFGGADGSYIAPCKSCIGTYEQFVAPPK
jgi:hypothetical protein